MSIKSKIIFYISILFIVAIGNGLLTIALESYGEEKVNWINHTNEIIHTTEIFLSSMQDTETGQRGYLLTLNNSYLEPYHSGIMNAKENIESLKNLVSDNPDQIKRLDSIEESMGFKFEELKDTILLADENKIEQALAIVRMNNGKKYMDDIRADIRDFIHDEKILLEIRKSDYREHKVQITTLLVVELMLFVFLAIMSITFFHRNLFSPLKLLLTSTQDMEKGYKVDVSSITPKDEMGFLLSSFYKMNHKITNQVEQLNYKAHHDELTGLLNRTNIHNEIQKSIKNFPGKIAIVFIDLNKFKQLNDTLGHDAGDEVLKETARRLKESTRANDKVFRLGGDEFVIIIKNLPDNNIIDLIILKILKAFKNKITIFDKQIKITLSIGIAIAPDSGITSEDLLKRADIAMYESKQASNKRYVIFEDYMLNSR